jgi:Zn-dependent protease/CBS domain-containing protein
MAPTAHPFRPARGLRVAGIDVRVHWTFLLLLVWIFSGHVIEGHSFGVAAEGVAFALAIFMCVVLHELGHALMARRFGVRTRDITLYPIGGVARLERIPERPVEELWIAVAGPLVNFAIAAILWPLLDQAPGPDVLADVGGSLGAKLVYVNMSLGVFNLVPAFPMDGGRVLRALLAMRLPYVRATQVAAMVGRVLALGLAVLGLFGNAMLVLVAAFVFIAGQQEAVLVRTRALLEGVPVTRAMMTRFETIDASAPLSEAVALLLACDQENFPVLQGEQPVGVLTRGDLVRALSGPQRDSRVGDVMSGPGNFVDAGASLEAAFRRMQETGCAALPVLRGGELIGLITLEYVGRWLMLQDPPEQRTSQRPRVMRLA